ncbi:hypothetical protein BIW11_02505 [Tropilaelaps mercedesae]|uniref:Ig-like domain-containing protein n=1 Tax=Tropilaelaps mercedesae TaxID=418985 RepID=A0A1V9Y232_9ACAR|nr:hypothetical protein BIW11_02505 [Tropilaelaps mercedesae]
MERPGSMPGDLRSLADPWVSFGATSRLELQWTQVSRMLIPYASAEHSGRYTCAPVDSTPATVHVHVLQAEEHLARKSPSSSSTSSSGSATVPDGGRPEAWALSYLHTSLPLLALELLFLLVVARATFAVELTKTLGCRSAHDGSFPDCASRVDEHILVALQSSSESASSVVAKHRQCSESTNIETKSAMSGLLPMSNSEFNLIQASGHFEGGPRSTGATQQKATIFQFHPQSRASCTVQLQTTGCTLALDADHPQSGRQANINFV